MGNQTIVYKERIIIVAEELDGRVLAALRHARTVTDDLCVFGVFDEAGQEQELHQRWSAIAPEVPLILKRSDDGGIAAPLVDYLLSTETLSEDDPNVTVLLPRLIGASWWSRLLRDDNSKYLERRLTAEGFTVEVFPVYLQSDRAALALNKSPH